MMNESTRPSTSRPLSLLGVSIALALGLSACVAAEDAEELDLLEEDSDGSEDEEEAIEFRVLHDTCGDEEGGAGPSCAQICHASFDFCQDTVDNEHWDRCIDARDALFPACKLPDHQLPLATQLMCLNQRTACLTGTDPTYANVNNWYNANSGTCNTGLNNCLSGC